MFRILLLVCLSLLESYVAFANTGFREVRADGAGARPLDVAIWYPTAQNNAAETIGENIAFVGTTIVRNATPAPGKHPLLLLSHGYGGSWRNLNWLASQLANEGYIVAAPNHPGTTTWDKSPQAARQLWQRPRDLSRTLDKILAEPGLAGGVDPQRIAAAGHSLGGWTVLMLAGGRFDPQRFINDCRTHAVLSSCRLASTLGIDSPATAEKLASSARDPRISAVVLFDAGLLRGFTPASLQQLRVPVLILAAQVGSTELPAGLESGYIAAHLPAENMRYASVAGATHFSFMQLCKPGAEKVIDAHEPGEGIVCQDGSGASRAIIHQHLTEQVNHFLLRSFEPRPPRAGTR